MPAWVIPAIGAAAGLIGNVMNSRAQTNLNYANRQYADQTYMWQRQDALADWHMQNNYNSPAAQMERLKAAGLNPNLVYGDGANMVAQQVKNPSHDQASTQSPQYDFRSVGNSLMEIYDIYLKQQQTDNLKAAKEVSVQDAILRAQQTMESAIRTSKTSFELEQAKSLQPIVLEAAQQSLRKLTADTEFTLDENERKAAINAQTLQRGVEEILAIRLGRAKTEDERNQIKQAIKNMKVDYDIKKEDLRLRKLEVVPHGNWWINTISLLVDKYLKGGTGKVVDKQLNSQGKDILRPFYAKPGQWDQFER